MCEWSQTVYVSAAQRYWNPNWDSERNRAVYGDLASVEGVGSNLRIRLWREGAHEPDWAPVVKRLKAAADHVCFFTDVADFATRPSTLENVALHLAREFGPLELFEDENLGCRVRDGELNLIERTLNLQIEARLEVDPESGLARERGQLAKAARAIAPQFATDRGESTERWAERVFSELAARLPDLIGLTVDLGSQRRIRVTTRA